MASLIAGKVPIIPTDDLQDDPVFERAALRRALERSTAAMKRDGVPFALAGGYALWAHGAPEPDHDVDLVVAEPDVEQLDWPALRAAAAGSPSAEAFLLVTDRLGISTAAAAPENSNPDALKSAKQP